MDATELKKIIAEECHVGETDVDDEQLRAVQAILDRVGGDNRSEVKGALDEIRTEMQESKAAFERAMAEWKTKPKEEDTVHESALSRIKSLPDLAEAVQDDDRGDAEVNAFRREYDNLHILSSLLGKNGQRRPVRTLRYWDRLEQRHPRFTQAVAKAVDTATTGGGAEWAPTLYSREMQSLVYAKTVIAGALQKIQMPAQSWVLPFSPSGGTVYGVGEAKTVDAAAYTSTVPTSDSDTKTAKMLLGRIAFSSIFEEESITPAIGLFRDYSVRLMAQAMDSAIVNGDTTATHQDTGKSYNSTSAEAQWDGLRDIAMNTFTSATKSVSDFNADNVLSVLMLGHANYIQDPRDILWLIPPKLQAKWFLLRDSASNLVFMRSTPMGDSLVGAGGNNQIANFFGAPVLMSGYVWSDVNASGIYDGSTTTKSIILWLHRPSWAVYERREMAIEVVPQQLYGLNNVLVSWRGTFGATVPTDLGENFAGIGYNITT